MDPQVCDVHVRVHVLAHILWQLQKSERFHAPTVGSPKSKVWLRALWNHSQQPATQASSAAKPASGRWLAHMDGTPHQLRLQRSSYVDMDESTGLDDTASSQNDSSRPHDSGRLLSAGRALSARVRVDARADSSQPNANPCLQLKQASSQAASQAAEHRLRLQQACASAGHRVGDRCREFEQACRRALTSIVRPPTLQCTRPCGAVEAFERALRRCWLGVQERWPPCGAGGCDGGCLPRVMERHTWPRGRRQADASPAGAAAASPERRASQAASVATPVATPNSAGFPVTPVKTPVRVIRVQAASELPDDIAALKAQVIELQEDLKRSEEIGRAHV